jgi:uncharacterized protein
MARVLITGGTGLVGKALTCYLAARGYDIIILTRKKDFEIKQHADRIQYRIWDPKRQIIDPEAVRNTDYIVHLAGAGVAEKRWTRKRKEEILESRVKSSAFLVKSLREIPNQVKAVVSASAIGWYGPDGLRPFIETDPPATDFLGETCRLWESAVEPLTEMGIRLVKIRTGIALSRSGGALVEFKKPLRFGIAAILGGGKQKISWIHMDDLCRIYGEALENKALEGVYNAVAPLPVDNRTMVLSLAKKSRGFFFIPFHIPSFVLKAVLGGMSIELLKSTSVSASKIKSTGFQFLFPDLDAALETLI